MAQRHNIDCTEQPMTRYGTIQGPSRRYRRLRHPSFPASEWAAKNPLLQRGEIGAEIDTHRLKIGDGLTYWNDLPYASESVARWGDIVGTLSDQTDLQNALNGKVSTDGSSTMTGVLKMRASISFECAIAPYWHGVGFYKLNDDDSVTLIASLEYQDSFTPAENNVYNIGSTSKKWKNLYLSGKAYMSVINNGYDIAIPVTNSADEFALKSQLSSKQDTLTAGTNITITGTTISATDTTYTGSDGITLTGTNFTNSGVRAVVSGTANGTISVNTNGTSADVSVTGLGSAAYTASSDYATSAQGTKADTAVQPGDLATVATTGSYTDLLNKPTIPTVNDATITITQGGVTKGSFTLNQASDDTIEIDAGGSGYHPDLFDWKWADSLRNDVQWLRADTFSWQSGAVYQAAYKHLRNDMFNWYSWENNGTTIYTKKAYPEVGEKAYSDSALTTEVGEITDVTDTLDITVEKITVNSVVYDSVSGSNIPPTTETVGGVTVQYIPAEDGHKIVTDFHESEVADVYTATGVAWYYIIDYGLKRFKLPRSKHEHYGDRPVVGNGTSISLTTGSGTAYGLRYKPTDSPVTFGLTGNTAGQAVGTEVTTFTTSSNSANKLLGLVPDSTTSGIVSTPVQDTDQYKYLYFYVGEFTQTAIQNTAGLNAELFNGKVDVGHQVIAFQAPTAGNDYTWYRKYADGWVEQGGFKVINSASVSGGTYSQATVDFPIAMSCVCNWNCQAKHDRFNAGFLTDLKGAAASSAIAYQVNDSTSSFANPYVVWEIKGIAA